MNRERAERIVHRHSAWVAAHPESKYFPTLVKVIRTYLREGFSWVDVGDLLGWDDGGFAAHRVVAGAHGLRVV